MKDDKRKKVRGFDEDEILTELRERLEMVATHQRENREAAREDLRFRIGDQWPEKIKTKRDNEGLPCLVINRINGFIDQVVGDFRKNKLSIRVHPSDESGDKQSAEVIEGFIRNIEYCSSAEVAYQMAFESAVSCGFPGYIRVVTEYADDESFEQDIRILPVRNPFSVYEDPYSKKPDLSDSRFCIITDLIPDDEFEEQYPGVEKAGLDVYNNGAEVSWRTEKDIRVAEYYWRAPKKRTLVMLEDGRVVDKDQMAEGDVPALDDDQNLRVKTVNTTQIMWCKATANTILEGPYKVPGRIIPVIPCYGKEVVTDDKAYWYGLIRWAKDPQRSLNYARSKTAELLALAPKVPFIGTKKQFEGYEDEWKNANTSNKAYLVFNPDDRCPGKPERVAYPPPPTGWIQESGVAVDDLKATTGYYDASLGARSNETSGKAILARQKESDTASFAFVDNLARALKIVGKVIVDWLPYYYDTPRTLRVMDEEGRGQPVSVNGLDSQVDLTRGKYDVTIDVGPSFQTAMIEAANSMVEFLQVFPAAAPVIGDLIAESMDWPKSTEIAERLKALLPPAIQALENPQVAAQMQQQQQQQGPDPKVVEAQIKLKGTAMKTAAEVKKAQLGVAAQELHVMGRRHALGQQIAQNVIANNGMSQPGQPQMTVVGERGPEMVVTPPGTQGQVVPMSQGQMQQALQAGIPGRAEGGPLGSDDADLDPNFGMGRGDGQPHLYFGQGGIATPDVWEMYRKAARGSRAKAAWMMAEDGWHDPAALNRSPSLIQRIGNYFTTPALAAEQDPGHFAGDVQIPAPQPAQATQPQTQQATVVAGNGRQLTPEVYEMYRKAANNSRAKAIWLAQGDGWIVP